MVRHHLRPFHVGHVVGHILHFSQKTQLLKPLNKCKVSISKAQQAVLSSEIDTVLSEETIKSKKQGVFLIVRKLKI